MNLDTWHSPVSATMAVFLAGIAYFAVVMPWGVFQDPDAFYHAKMSLLLWAQGPVRSFPWLDLTAFGQSFADHHFLFHVIESPFVAWLGWAMGARVAAILLSALFLAAAYACLRWFRVGHPFVWTIMLALSHPLMVRLMLGKATPLALTLFVVGLAATWKRRPWIAGLVGFCFALSHGGWPFLLGSVALVMIGDIAFRTIVADERLTDAIRRSLWPEFTAVASGIVIGTVVHPNFPANLSFLWTQIVTIGLRTPFDHVMLGNEWLPSPPSAVLASLAPWLIALILGLAGLLLARKKDVESDRMRAAIAFAIPVAVLVALTFKSRRNVEYLVPALAFWIPWIWSMIDMAAFRQAFSRGTSRLKRDVVPIILTVVMVITVGKGAWSAYSALHAGGHSDAEWRVEMAAISAKADPGDRVFHTDWDEFPILFNIDDRLKYVSGLDPTFLYVASSTLSDAYRDVTWGNASTTKDQAWDLIHGRMDSQFVFVDKRDHASFLDLMKSDNRYIPLIETSDAAAFEVDPMSP
jgi:hypothetical protein